MTMHTDTGLEQLRPGIRQWVAAAAFLAIAVYLSLQYQAYWFALLPLGLALACPLVHLFRHRGQHREQSSRQRQRV